LLALILALPAPAQQSDAEESAPPPASPTLDVEYREEVEVRLVLIDVVVLDSRDRTVPDLTLDDFEVIVEGERRPIDTLDVACGSAPLDDAVAVSRPGRRGPPPGGAPAGRKIVLALDYLHLSRTECVDVLEHARDMVRNSLLPGDQVMLAALNGGLRIEQTFSDDPARIADSLKRMEYDISLWQPDFFHLTELPFFTGMQTLMEVLTNVSGPKAVVLYSNSPARADTLDLQFSELAALAASARCAIYPVQASGLTARGPG
jgi:VWFA-related protein